MMSSFHVRAVLPVSALAIVGVMSVQRVPEAAKSLYPQACSVTFTDNNVNRIHSDARGPYTDAAYPLGGGDAAVSCQVAGINSDSIKLSLNLPKSNRLPRRTFVADYLDAITAGALIGTRSDGNYLIIEHVGLMSAGTTTANAHFGFNSGTWFFNWCGVSQGGCQNFPGSDAVAVTRTSATHWDVTTDSPGGDVAQLQDGVTNSFLYHMPFQLSIDCPGCKLP